MNAVVLGAVAYDPKVVTIWSGFRSWLRRNGLPFDFVLYSHYERQAEDLVHGRIDAAWHSPLAWLRSSRLARAAGVDIRPLVMRDTDRDLTSVVVVRAQGPVTVTDLKGRTVAVGAVDSPQATLLPLQHLRELGLEAGCDVDVRRHDTGVGLHGDHIGGEREAARALMNGEVAAACMIDTNYLLFGQEGTLPPGTTRLLTRTAPFDHCVLAAGPSLGPAAGDRLTSLLLSMSVEDPEARHLMHLEGLTRWMPGRESGYASLTAAVDATGFYDKDGRVTAADYRP
ncbi:phosphate/phosphite/phosphonate ABC transporter substrate-binding protein [Streptomyces sp. ICN988]|uniref:phosphate/phosphite/phosphonate ABC transporter substrate-binding protein n=1 Tax=Streptomyces sp. ICN988 TaxID=2983765 RepID=UPI0021E5136B|nr:phosphate/phosphite/phosphonate ABC transporter substrate-binding protein [Streptomyces sp. ICN988]MCV2460964.1 phosphate/phosphite/phosphonate ABC transporter substrate-binding protein [Streptomyces sp. ICN988]